MALQFFDCPNCQKSLRVGARSCHHCHAVDENDWADPDAAVEFASGGYTPDELEVTDATASKWWRRIVVLVTLLLLLSFFLQAILLAAEPVNYLSEIKPILQDRCYACHGALKQEADLRVDTATLLRSGGASGTAIVDNASEQSLLIARLTAQDADDRMPPEGAPLTEEQIQLIALWISQGAPAPSDELTEEDPRQHWAFQRPLRPAVPSPQKLGLSHNIIDAFIGVEHQRLELTPMPPAEKNLLLRRVYLDLIGVPPTLQELQAFMSDDSPEAYEQVVSRLLGSPQYGERWARHWMDVWRYSDWYGRREVPDVWNSAPQIWRWRDWIVNSLNADHGYDRMVREMLSADEIIPESDEACHATGYLIRNWYALNPNDWMRNIVEHTGKAFLGLTFNCAHCHDHKYDPITHDDYFRMRAFFEPIYVRQDRVPGQADPGPFADYDYSRRRNVQRLGAVRIFDKSPNAETWFYSGGDERNRDSQRGTIAPGVPEFLEDCFPQIEPVELPSTAWYPGLRPALQDAVCAAARQALSAAEENYQIAKTQAIAPTATTVDRLTQAEAALAAAQKQAEKDPTRTALEGQQSLFLTASTGRCFLQNRLSQLTSLENQSTLEFQLQIRHDTHFNFQFAKDVTKGLTAGYVAFDQGRIVSYQPGSFTEFDAGHYDFAAGQSLFHVSLVLQTDADQCLLNVISLSDDHQLIKNLPIALNGWNPVGDPTKAITFDARSGSAVAIDELILAGPDGIQPGSAGCSVHFDFEGPLNVDGSDVVGVGGWEASNYSLAPGCSLVSRVAPDENLCEKLHELEVARRAMRGSSLPLLIAESRVIASRAELDSVAARVEADRARYGKAPAADSDALIRQASRLERQAGLCSANANLLTAEQALVSAESKSADAAQPDPELEQARKKLAAAKLEVARAAQAIHDQALATSYTAFSPTYPQTSTGRRRALGQWITSRNNPLTARVAVNHMWLRHFHSPLVASLNDFGRNGHQPTHPQLLDWLAVEFMDSGWSMKHLHRLIVCSAAYRRGSGAKGAAAWLAIDPDNRLLWRMNTGRMEAEVIRDSLLQCAGQLDTTLGGQELENSESFTTARRSLYYSVYPEQGGMSPLGELFDGPDSLDCYRRTRTVVPQQALVMTNSEWVHKMSAMSVDNWKRTRGATTELSASDQMTGSSENFVIAMFKQILSRPPSATELGVCVAAFEQQRSLFPGSNMDDQPSLASVQASLIRVLFSHSDFVTVR